VAEMALSGEEGAGTGAQLPPGAKARGDEGG